VSLYGKPVVTIDGVPLEDVEGVEMREAPHRFDGAYVCDDVTVHFGAGTYFEIVLPEGNRHERRKRAAQERRR